jgi:hypothetical protein
VLYELIVKIVGADILWALAFFTFNLSYHDNLFTIEASMRQPVTEEIESVVKKGLEFRIEQSICIIINDSKSYNRLFEKKLSWKNGWFVNGFKCNVDNLQFLMGSVKFATGDFRFDEGDDVLIFVEYKIKSDEGFTNSTGLNTQVLWKFYTPSSKQEFIFKNGTFIPK